MLKRHLKNKSGFTLLEIMITIAIASGLMLAIASMLRNGQKGAKKISQDIEVSNMMNVILNTMRDKANCQNVLQGKALTVAPVTITQITMGAVVIAQTATGQPANPTPIYGNAASGVIYIDSMQILNYNAAARKLTLRINFVRKNTNLNGVDTPAPREITLMVFDQNADGVFTTAANDSCYSNDDYYVLAACSSIGGTLENGLCKKANILNLTGDAVNPALRLNGDLLVSASADASQAGQVTAANNITSTGGNILASTGNITATVGNVVATAGNLILGPNKMVRLNSNGTLEIAAGTVSGAGANLTLNSTNVATLNASSSLTINGPTNINGITNINGATNINGNTGITGNATVSADITSTAGFMYLNKTPAQLGAPGTTGNMVVNKDWVYNLLSASVVSQLTPAQRDAIVQEILNVSQNTNWYTMARNVHNQIALVQSTVALGGGSDCAAGSFVTGLNWVIPGVESAGSKATFTYSCTVPPINNCATMGNCANVYTNASFCINGPTRCMSNIRQHVWGGCYWTTSFVDPSTGGLTTSLCTTNYFQAGIRSNWAVFCCPSIGN